MGHDEGGNIEVSGDEVGSEEADSCSSFNTDDRRSIANGDDGGDDPAQFELYAGGTMRTDHHAARPIFEINISKSLIQPFRCTRPPRVI